MATFKLYLHISNCVPRGFTSITCCLRQMRIHKPSGGKRHCYSRIAHTHLSLLAASQNRGVVQEQKYIIRAIPRDVQGV